MPGQGANPADGIDRFVSRVMGRVAGRILRGEVLTHEVIEAMMQEMGSEQTYAFHTLWWSVIAASESNVPNDQPGEVNRNERSKS